jgi:hypothetical protein
MIAAVGDSGGGAVIISSGRATDWASSASGRSRRFMALRERGLGIDAPACQVGHVASRGKNLVNGVTFGPVGGL